MIQLSSMLALRYAKEAPKRSDCAVLLGNAGQWLRPVACTIQGAGYSKKSLASLSLVFSVSQTARAFRTGISMSRRKIKRKRNRRFWYFCTSQFKGERWTSKLIVPPFKGTNEPDTPRLCVARYPSGCLAARLFRYDVCVYRTIRPVCAIKPVGVHDAVITGERWIVHPTELELKWLTPQAIVRRISDEEHGYMMRFRKPPPHAMRARTLIRAAVELSKQGIPVGKDAEIGRMCERYLGDRRAAG